MDEQPQVSPEAGSGKGVPPEGAPAGSGGGAGAGFPRPPGLLKRMVLLCLQPESWAQAARYRTGVSVSTLLATIVVMSVVVGVSTGVSAVRALREFGAVYDKIYPALEVSSAGVLSVRGEIKEPLRYGIGPYRVLVDPRLKEVPDSLLESSPIVVTDRQLVESWGGLRAQYDLKDAPLFSKLVPPEGMRVIDGASIQGWLARHGTTVMGGVALVVFVARLVADLLWSALMVLAIYPLPILAAGIGAEAFVIPRRAGVRMALAVLVPLVVVGGVLEAVGRSATDLMGPQVVFFWMAAAALLAFWSGRIARRLYGPKARAREAE